MLAIIKKIAIFQRLEFSKKIENIKGNQYNDQMIQLKYK